MEAVLRRTALVKSQAKRKARILEHKKLVRDRVQYRLQNSLLCKETTASIRNARKTRREDWELGSIAPWRAAAAYATVAGTIADGGSANGGGASSGAGPGTGASGTARDDFFGTFSARRLNPPKVPEKYRVKDWFVREGDRCVVVEGREGVKGKIGLVKAVDKETEMVTLEGINMVSLNDTCARALWTSSFCPACERKESRFTTSSAKIKSNLRSTTRSTYAFPPQCKQPASPPASTPPNNPSPSPPSASSTLSPTL